MKNRSEITMTSPTDIAKDLGDRELRSLAEKATPGPWDVWSEPCASIADAEHEAINQIQHSEPFDYAMHMLNAGGKCPALTGCGPTSKANAHYLAAVDPQTILSLLDRLEAVERERDHYRLTLARIAALDEASGYTLTEGDAFTATAYAAKALGGQDKAWAIFSDWIQKDTSVSGPINTSHVGENHE